MTASDIAQALVALRAWSLTGAALQPLAGGLINRTYLVRSEMGRHVLQRMSPIFSVEVNLDMDRTTEHLEIKGLTTPRLVPTSQGALWTELDGAFYRLQTFVDGVTLPQLVTPAQVRAAATGVARFHAAAADLQWTFRSQRAFAHDTPAHLARLKTVVQSAHGHRMWQPVAMVAEAIAEHGQQLPAIGQLPQRVIHGDLKCQNLLFGHGQQHLVALVDLDTLCRGTLAVEMGDALRSWCNPSGEEAADAKVDLELFQAAIESYAEQAGPTVLRQELDAFAPGLETIALELAARFCADAVEESYFGWDASRFAGRAEHNLVRAESQLALAGSARRLRGQLADLTASAVVKFGSSR